MVCEIPALFGFAAPPSIYLRDSRCPGECHPFRYPHSASMDESLKTTDPGSVHSVPYLHIDPQLLMQGMPAPLA